MAEDASDCTPITGEARLRVEGGVGHFPGLAREKVVAFSALPVSTVREIVELAGRADFFGRSVPDGGRARDARTYTVCLSVGDRSRELRVGEPVRDPSLAALISTLRRLPPG